jgi:hypothetical protein
MSLNDLLSSNSSKREGSRGNLPGVGSTLLFLLLATGLVIVSCTGLVQSTPVEMESPEAITAPAKTISTIEQPSAILPTEDSLAMYVEVTPTMTITGKVRGVVPEDMVIVLDSEVAEARQAFLLQLRPESKVYDLENREIDLTGIEEGMIIQGSGQEQTEGILLTGHIQVLALPPVPDSPPVQGSPTPVGPITLADVSPDWEQYDLPEFGVKLSIPVDWEISRMPGSYFFVPAAMPSQIYPTQLTVGHRLNVPAQPQAMAATIVEQWRRLTPFDFYTTPVIVSGYEGIALWNLSPATCAGVYVAAHNVVYEFGFYSAFCNEIGDGLNDFGERVLTSIELYPPHNQD